MKQVLLTFLVACLFASVAAQSVWEAGLDGKPNFYQTTDFGIVLAATQRSLYALDGKTGKTIWRKGYGGLNETSIVAVPATDLILISLDLGEKSRIEAIDLLSGESIWRSEKLKGDLMQVAVEPQDDLLAVVLAKDAKGRLGEKVKKAPIIHLLRLSDGEEIWKEKLESEIEMMPASFDENAGEVSFTLDNYRPPLILDGKVFLFYEGITVYDARTGKKLLREKFRVNESGLALTDADVVFDDKFIYTSGRGKVRAINRRNLKVEWDSKDLGVCAEMAVLGGVLYVRTGGQFTRIEDGKTEQKEPFGLAAIDVKEGETLWRYRDADKGMTNFVFANPNTILFADSDKLISIDAKTGKTIGKVKHKIEKAQFVSMNESGAVVVGGKEEIAAFRFASNGNFTELWRAKHEPPSRGLLRTIAGIALRAVATYFRYGGAATSFISGIQSLSLAQKALRWSGLKFRFASFDLTTLASSYLSDYLSKRVALFGIASRLSNADKIAGLQIIKQSAIRNRIIGAVRDDLINESVRASDYLLRRKKLSELRSNYIYFYTDLPKPYNKKGLAGVNVNTGKTERFIVISEPDPKFVIDENMGLLYSADGSKIKAFSVY